MTALEVFALISGVATLLAVEFLIRASAGGRHAQATLSRQQDMDA